MSKILDKILNYICTNGVFKDSNGDISTSNHFILPNNNSLLSKTAGSPSTTKNLIGLSSANQVLIGYNGSDGNEISTNLYGNTTTINGKTIVNLKSGNNTYAFTSTGQLRGIQTPSNATDAANKQYVDNRTIDFVIENGATTMTTNLPVGWRWRKWDSGYMEAWGRYEVSNVSFSNTTTGYYALIGTANFPMDLKEAPYCQATVDFGNVGSISTSSLSKTSVTLAVWSASNQSRTCIISLYIMAKYSI